MNQYFITIYFEITTGGYVIAGDNHSVALTKSSDRITHTYIVDSMDTNNGVVKKPYQVCYRLVEKVGEYYHKVVETDIVTYNAYN